MGKLCGIVDQVIENLLDFSDIGIDVQINCTKDHNSIRKDPTAWDIWVSANVNAGLGDPQNFFDTYCLDESVKNSGGHHSDKLEQLAVQLRTTFDPAERAKIAVEMQQQLLDDKAFQQIALAMAQNHDAPLQHQDIDMYLDRLENARPLDEKVRQMDDSQFSDFFANMGKKKGAKAEEPEE